MAAPFDVVDTNNTPQVEFVFFYVFGTEQSIKYVSVLQGDLTVSG